mgnify:CR=1 FL=1
MPLYEYKCHKCGALFEVLQKVSDEPLSVHDHCGGRLERLLSPPAFQFKGSGWYVTDYARSSSSNKSVEKPSVSEVKSDSSKPAETSKPASSEKK